MQPFGLTKYVILPTAAFETFVLLGKVLITSFLRMT
jgi:hypothetical protein